MSDDLWPDDHEYRATREQLHNARRAQRTRPLAQVEIETAIAAIVDDLEMTTEEYASISDEEAEAENAYKAKYHRALIVLAERKTLADGTRSTADWREAQAGLTAEDEAARYRIAVARLRACKEALITKRARLDALRTLAANVRTMVG